MVFRAAKSPNGDEGERWVTFAIGISRQKDGYGWLLRERTGYGLISRIAIYNILREFFSCTIKR